MPNAPRRPRIALTAGEPAGVGPELVARLATHDFGADLVVIADRELIADRAGANGVAIDLQPWSVGPATPTSGTLACIDIRLRSASIAGQLERANAGYVLQTLARAADGARSGEFDAIVTAPVHKGIINDSGVAFSGHTEFFAGHAGCDVVLLLVADSLRVALAPTHPALSAVPAAITRDSLLQTLRILAHDLRERFAIADPVIAVLGLNPHAGEGGHLGREEIDTIIPVIEQVRGEGLHVVGPLPADTASYRCTSRASMPCSRCTTTRPAGAQACRLRSRSEHDARPALHTHLGRPRHGPRPRRYGPRRRGQPHRRSEIGRAVGERAHIAMLRLARGSGCIASRKQLASVWSSHLISAVFADSAFTRVCFCVVPEEEQSFHSPAARESLFFEWPKKVTQRKAPAAIRGLRHPALDFANGLRGSLTARPCTGIERAGVLPAPLRAFPRPFAAAEGPLSARILRAQDRLRASAAFLLLILLCAQDARAVALKGPLADAPRSAAGNRDRQTV